MSFIKKSITYDQKRKLMFLSIILTLVLSFITIQTYQNIVYVYEVTENITFNHRTNMNLRMLTLFLIFVIVVISIGFKERSERLCITAMPMNKDEILLTKFFCTNIAVLGAFFINFILESILYLINRNILISGGYYFQNVIVVNVILVISAMLIIGGVFLINLIYSNVKISLFIFIAGFLSIIYLFGTTMDSISLSGSKAFNYIYNQIDIVVYCDRWSLDMYTNNILGSILFWIGFIILIYTIIFYVSSTFKNDPYNNIYVYKRGKTITRIIMFIITLALITYILNLIVSGVYFNKVLFDLDNSTDDKRLTMLLLKKFIIIEVISLIASYFINKKFINKMENIIK